MTLKEWYVSPQKAYIERGMLRLVGDATNLSIKKMMEKQIFPSKRIRSYFLFLLTRDYINDLMFNRIAVAIELFHQATLIFDDVIDNSNDREGNRITLHQKFGGGISGAGKADHLASILMLLSEQEMTNIPYGEVIERFNTLKLEMFVAQLKDTFVIQKNDNISYIDWLLKETYKKTSSFMEFPFFIHTAVSNMFIPDKIKSVIEMGNKIGILYQIADDLFDLDNGIKTGTLSLTYPLAYLLDNRSLLSRKEYNFLKQIMKVGFLNETSSNELLKLFNNHRDMIINSSKIIFKNYSEFFEENNSIEYQNKTLILDVLNKAVHQDYWNYK